MDSVNETHYRHAFSGGPRSFDRWLGGREAWARYEWEYCDVPVCSADEPREAEEPSSCLSMVRCAAARLLPLPAGMVHPVGFTVMVFRGFKGFLGFGHEITTV